MKIQIGSISHGTLITEDLVRIFYDTLNGIDLDRALSYVMDIKEMDDGQLSEETVCDVLSDLFDALDEYAPGYCYFGSHEGDDSDYGFWPSQEAIRDGIWNKELLKVDDLAAIPERYSGAVVLVNDHGNMTLYSPRIEWDEVWSIV